MLWKINSLTDSLILTNLVKSGKKKRQLPNENCRFFYFGGATRNRTGDKGFADLCLTAWLWRR